MDLESVADELYGLRPDRFTAARDVRAAEARRSGDRALADAIRALRRPTLAAWASNLLVRERPEEARALVALGEGLRDAHHTLDGPRLRELSHRHALVTALARQARRLASEAGQPVGDDVQREVEATLQAVLADPRAAGQWAAGRLAKPLSAPVGFTPVSAAPTTAAGRRPSRPVAAGTGRAGKQARQDAERRRAELDRARRDAESAEREARAGEEERQRAESGSRRAAAELEEAGRRVTTLAEELKRAEEDRRAADARARAAGERAHLADRAAARARRRAEDTALRAERLAAEEG
ncbi:hypothetical protein ACLGI4_02260 [Streptomyces sp. HMX112]|uniref:hypothetical protein n=1 Tax=Streptomyces sp. HMX112 TaxID=3390850 RepID=UPI003A802C7C